MIKGISLKSLLVGEQSIISTLKSTFAEFGMQGYVSIMRYVLLRVGLVKHISSELSLPQMGTPGDFSTSVSIVIPLRDGVADLKKCLDSIWHFDSGIPFELIVVDNGSIKDETKRYLKEISRTKNVKIISADFPFNYSKLNNLAVAESKFEFLCLLNNDTTVLTSNWLRNLVMAANMPEAGAVGPLLLYPDQTIQHAGVSVGQLGLARNMFSGLSLDSKDAKSWCTKQRPVHAVTGACLVVKKSKFLEVGGMCEELPVGFNDVDFCLELAKAGYVNIFEPAVSLTHYESKTRGSNHLIRLKDATKEVVYMLTKWGI